MQGDRSQPSSEPAIESIDLNADLGEHDGDGYARDELLLRVVSSTSIACGAHAGNHRVMEETSRRAAGFGVTIGAHPSYPDREGFGRRVIEMPVAAVIESVRAQVGLLLECAARAGAAVRYVKPHGALYNRAMTDQDLATALVDCVKSVDPTLPILALPGSAMADAAASASMRVAREAFIDRAYTKDGTLVARAEPGSTIEDDEIAASRAIMLARDGLVTCMDGTVIEVHADSLCTHGDNPHALQLVTATRAALEQSGIRIAPFA